MTRDEKFAILDSIKLENDFYPVVEQDCREENAALIENMERIFDLRDGRDYTCLFAVADLLADKDKAQAVKDYLLAENSYKKEDVVPPDWEDKLLVSTAMEDNPLFFSMAWNWTCLTEARVSGTVSGTGSDTAETGGYVLILKPEDAYEVQYQAAAKAGFAKFGMEHPIGKYGKLGQEGCSDDRLKGLFFYMTLSDEYQEKPVSLNIEFECLADNEIRRVSLDKAAAEKKERIKSKTVKADISKGIRILKVELREK